MNFYRYEVVRYASRYSDYLDEVKIELITLNLHKETPQGYWIGYGNLVPGNLRSQSKWVSKGTRKRYAYPTKEEAMQSFIARTERRKRILSSQLNNCKEALRLALKIEL